MADAWLTTTIGTPNGPITVETLDFDEPGYECDGFESVTTLPSGETWGIGPEEPGETPLSLHLAAVQSAVRERAL